jgi:farnesyl diphosphate synthase
MNDRAESQSVMLNQKVLAVAAQIETVLAGLLNTRSRRSALGRSLEGEKPALLLEAMAYASLGAGKRFRPFLVYETAQLLGASGPGLLRAGAALELVHCYSLVHDDLPAMDNDALRRGKATVHIAYDEATAILTGDALLTLAFDVLADPKTAKSGTIRLKLIQILAKTAGIGGMIGGQMLDLAAEGRFANRLRKPGGEAGIIRIQSMKTGALIVAACRMGAILGKARKQQVVAIDNYAHALGLAFQIKDDLLDVEGNSASLGKAAGKDASAGKATFVSLRGIDGARAMLDDVSSKASVALTAFGTDADTLRALLVFNRERQS